MVDVYIFKGDKNLSHQYLFALLERDYGIIVDETHLKRTEYGKLYLIDNPVYFNISHSKDNIAIVISDTEVAIDCELIKDKFYGREIFGVKPVDSQHYAELWTQAESIVKYKASSILLNLKRISLADEPTYDGKPLGFNLFTFLEENIAVTVATNQTAYTLKTCF